MNAGCYLDAVEGLFHHLGPFAEACAVFVCPPVEHVTVLVELATLVIEAVRHLVTDDNTNRAVVEGIVGIHVKEGVLQNTCGEADLVAGGVVVGIHRLGSHVPFLLVHRFVQEREAVSLFELSRALEVGVIGVSLVDVEVRVVAPFVGITYLDGEGFEFFDGFCLGLVAHPFGSADAVAQSGLQVLHQGQHALFVFLGEVFLDVHLAYSLAQCTIDDTHGAFPQRRGLFLTREDATVEIEVSHVNLGAQVGGGTINHLPCKQGLEVINRFVSQHLTGFLQVCYLAHRQYARLDAHGVKIDFPIYLRNELLQLVNGHLVVVGNGVTQFHIVLGGFCQTCLHAHNGLGALGGVLVAEEFKHTCDMLSVCLANSGSVFVIVNVILFLAQRKTGLALVEDVHGAVQGIGLNIHTPDTEIHGSTEYFAQLSAVGNSLYLTQGSLDGLKTLRIPAGGIHSQRV